MSYCPKSGKLRHKSQYSAAKATNLYKRRHRATGKVYRCPHCGDWHNTRMIHDVAAPGRGALKVRGGEWS